MQRHAQLAPQPRQQLQDLRLDGHVERGGRLVGDEQRRPAGERHRDHHALPHAARHLVRIVVHAPLGIGDADQLEAARPPRRARVLASTCRDAAAAARRPARPSSCTGLSDVIGSWKIMRDLAAAHLAHLAARAAARGRGRESAPAPPMMRPGRIAHQAHDRQRGHRLAAARLADDAERAAGREREADAVDGAKLGAVAWRSAW